MLSKVRIILVPKQICCIETNVVPGSNMQGSDLHKRASWTVAVQNIKNSGGLGRDFAATARSGSAMYVTLANKPNGTSQPQPYNLLWQEGTNDWALYPLSTNGNNIQVDGGVATVVRSTARMESFFGRGNEIYSYYFSASDGAGNWYSSNERKAKAAAVGTRYVIKTSRTHPDRKYTVSHRIST